MKHVITVSMGPSAQDYSFKTKFLGKDFTVTRQGANGDEDRAWDLLRRAQADADAVGLGMIRDHYDVGTRRFVHKDTDKLLKVVKKALAKKVVLAVKAAKARECPIVPISRGANQQPMKNPAKCADPRRPICAVVNSSVMPESASSGPTPPVESCRRTTDRNRAVKETRRRMVAPASQLRHGRFVVVPTASLYPAPRAAACSPPSAR